MTIYEPLQVALAWIVTKGDEPFADLVRRNSGSAESPNGPYFLAEMLADEMSDCGAVLVQPRALGPKRANFNTLPVDRFQDLIADFKKYSGIDPDTEFKFRILIEFLEHKLAGAWVELRTAIGEARIKATGVLVDRDGEHPAQDILPSAIVPSMIVHRDGVVRQNPAKAAPAWQFVRVSWSGVTKLFDTKVQSQKSGPATRVDEGNCELWLTNIMRASPKERTRKKSSLLAEAIENWGQISIRRFDAIFAQAAKKAKAEAWLKGGALKKRFRGAQ